MFVGPSQTLGRTGSQPERSKHSECNQANQCEDAGGRDRRQCRRGDGGTDHGDHPGTGHTCHHHELGHDGRRHHHPGNAADRARDHACGSRPSRPPRSAAPAPSSRDVSPPTASVTQYRRGRWSTPRELFEDQRPNGVVRGEIEAAQSCRRAVSVPVPLRLRWAPLRPSSFSRRHDGKPSARGPEITDAVETSHVESDGAIQSDWMTYHRRRPRCTASSAPRAAFGNESR